MLKESELKESRKWKYKEIIFDFTKYEQISMFEEDKNVSSRGFCENRKNEIGIVGWTENKCMGVKAEDGYIGIDLKTGSCGFLAPVKVDKCAKSNLDELLEVLENEKKEVETRLRKNLFNKKLFDEKCKENELLKQLLSIYINKGTKSQESDFDV